MIIEIRTLTLRNIQMPPRCRGHLVKQAEPHITQENHDPLAEPTIAQALGSMAKVMRKMSQTNRREERQPETEGDRALERFMRFNPP
jgi:hypothetical protein